MAAPDPLMPAHVATALARSSFGKMLVMIDSVAGITMAPAMPMTTRAPMSWLAELATKAANAVATPNSARPPWRMPLRPYRSPMFPAVNRRPANTSEYASTIHCSCELVAESFSDRTGSATFSVVLPMMMMSSARQSAPSVFHRRS